MRHAKTAILSASLLALVACADAPDEATAGTDTAEDGQATGAAQAEAATPGTVVTVEGIRTNGADLDPADAITFGTPRDAAVAFVTELRGEPTEEPSSNMCPAGPMEFTKFGNLTLNFQGDTLVGWALDGEAEGAPITTPNGLTIGSTRAEVDAAPQVIFEETSLGTEFTADGADGVMSEDGPDGVVTNLWAGTPCIFR